MKKERRWLKSAIAASAETQVVMPWARGQRRRPEAMKDAPVAAKPRAALPNDRGIDFMPANGAS